MGKNEFSDLDLAGGPAPTVLHPPTGGGRPSPTQGLGPGPRGVAGRLVAPLGAAQQLAFEFPEISVPKQVGIPGQHSIGDSQRDSQREKESSFDSELSADGRSVLWDGYVNDKDKELRRTYGLKLEHYMAILGAQNGVCGVCHRKPRRNEWLHVDHDHQTGEIRGLLCRICNRRVLESVARYIINPPARSVGPFTVSNRRMAMKLDRQAKKSKGRKLRRKEIEEKGMSISDLRCQTINYVDRIALALRQTGKGE